jgi:hypothetical protein
MSPIQTPARSGIKPIATSLAGLSLGLASAGASAGIIYFQPDGGSLTAIDHNDNDRLVQYIDIDLSNLGAISATIKESNVFGSPDSEVDHLYLSPLNVWQNGTRFFEPDIIVRSGSTDDHLIAKSGNLESGVARVFDSGELINAAAFDTHPDGDRGDILNAVEGFLGFRYSRGGEPDLFGWVQFNIGSISTTGLAIDDSGAAIAAGNTGQGVPLPPSLALLATGVAGLAATRRRRRRLDA